MLSLGSCFRRETEGLATNVLDRMLSYFRDGIFVQ